MNCQQIKESLGDHSVGLLEAEPRTAFDQHVAICAECARSVREFERCMELLNHTPSPVPPADLWMGVRARLELERSLAQYASQYPEASQPVRDPRASWWSGTVAALSGFAAAAGVLMLLSLQPSGGPATMATTSEMAPVTVSVSQHSLMGGSSPVADGSSVVAADAVSTRPVPGRVRHPRVILPGRELLGEPITSVELGAIMSRPMPWPSAPNGMEDAR